MECSILKVRASEMLDMVVDHVLQIYAGYGCVEEYPAERAYCDSRINRIFEGANEINRLIITGWLMEWAVAGQLPLLASIKKLMDEVMAGPSAAEEGEGLGDQQEVMGALADCIMEVFALESCILRGETDRGQGREGGQAGHRHDPVLCGVALQTRGADAVNFNHIRSMGWS